jgi:hypothetical protein
MYLPADRVATLAGAGAGSRAEVVPGEG